MPGEAFRKVLDVLDVFFFGSCRFAGRGYGTFLHVFFPFFSIIFSGLFMFPVWVSAMG